jgi:hypothetical protein
MLRRIRQNGQLSSFDLGSDFQRLRFQILEPLAPTRQLQKAQGRVQFSVLRRGGKLDSGPRASLDAK